MKKKQPWMFKGNIVLAYGNPAVIHHMQENTIDNVEYVYYIYCKYPQGNKIVGPHPFHPNDVHELPVKKFLTFFTDLYKELWKYRFSDGICGGSFYVMHTETQCIGEVMHDLLSTMGVEHEYKPLPKEG